MIKQTLVEDSVLRLTVESKSQPDKKGFELVKEDIIDVEGIDLDLQKVRQYSRCNDSGHSSLHQF